MRVRCLDCTVFSVPIPCCAWAVLSISLSLSLRVWCPEKGRYVGNHIGLHYCTRFGIVSHSILDGLCVLASRFIEQSIYYITFAEFRSLRYLPLQIRVRARRDPVLKTYFVIQEDFF